MPTYTPQPIDLTTLANVRAWLILTANSDDDLLQRLITGISKTVLNYLNRAIATASYTETVNGNGHTSMMVGNYPITAVTSVVVDGHAIPPRPALGQRGYLFDNDTIYLDGACFTRCRGNVVLQYTAGYAATPPDLEQAVIELVSLRYKERERIGHVSKSIQGETVAFSLKSMPDDVRDTLNNYRRVTPLTGQ